MSVTEKIHLKNLNDKDQLSCCMGSSYQNSGDSKGHLECEFCIFRKLCISNDLQPDALDDFNDVVLHSKPLPKGKHLYRQDSPFQSVYIIHSGAVKVYRVSPDGEERVLGFYLPGELIGTDGLYNHRYINSAMTLDTTTVCELPFAEFAQLFSQQQRVQASFLSRLYGEVLEEQQMFLLGQKSSEQRVAAFLMNLSHRYQRRRLSAYALHLPMSRKDIASHLGLAVETVSRVLSRFQERSWIEVCGREIKLLNPVAMDNILHDCQEGYDL